jgi:hypothetical protein
LAAALTWTQGEGIDVRPSYQVAKSFLSTGRVSSLYTYLNAFDAVINLEVRRLRDRRAVLMANLSQDNGRMRELEIPETKEYELTEIDDPDSRIKKLFGDA